MVRDTYTSVEEFNKANALSAGIPLQAAAGTKTGVYVGCFSSDYRSIMEKDLDRDLTYAATGVCCITLPFSISFESSIKYDPLTFFSRTWSACCQTVFLGSTT